MPQGETDQGLGSHIHGFEFLPFIQAQGIIRLAEAFQSGGDIGPEIRKSLSIDFITQNRMAGSPLLLELGKYSGPVGLYPGGIHFPENLLSHGPFFPKGNNPILIDFAGFRRYLKSDFFPGIQNVQIFQVMGANFRIGGGGLGGGAPFSHDQVPGIDAQGFMLQYIFKSQGPLQGH